MAGRSAPMTRPTQLRPSLLSTRAESTGGRIVRYCTLHLHEPAVLLDRSSNVDKLTSSARSVAPDASSWTNETTAPAQDATAMRIVLIEWRIRKGQEEQFLEYWSTRAVVQDRSGLIGEFLSRVESQQQYPWITWEVDERWTTFVNVGLWREASNFEEQIGRYMEDTRPPMAFEAARRRRVMLAPERWRTGGTNLPNVSHDLVH